MPPGRIYELRRLYFQSRRPPLAASSEYQDKPSWLSGLADGIASGRLNLDLETLRQGVPLQKPPVSRGIAAQVFGPELENQYLDLKHSLNVLQERQDLHRRHLQEIEERHIKVQERLFGVEINHFPDRNKQLRTLEGQLIQLEQQRREEELAFWKDTVELRKLLWENAHAYKDTRHRYRLLAGEEPYHGR